MQATRQRGFTGRKEGKALLQMLDQMMVDLTAEDFQIKDGGSLFTGKLATYLLVWNELILQLKCHNEDYALLCQRLKTFVQLLFSHIPVITEQYEQQLKSLQEILATSEATISEINGREAALAKEIESSNERIQQLTDLLAQTAKDEQVLRDDRNEALFRLDEATARGDDMAFRVGKQEETIRALTLQITQKDAMIEQLNTQISNQEEVIRQLKEEDAGFQPRYTKALSELVDLTEKYQEALGQIAILEMRATTVDIATEPIPELILESHAKTGGKKGSKKGALLPKGAKTQVLPITIGKNRGSGVLMASSSENSSRSGRESETDILLPIPPTQPAEKPQTPPQVPESGSVISDEPIIEPEAVLVGVDVLGKPRPLPSNYRVRDDALNEQMLGSSPLVTFVDKLFPLPRIDGIPRANFGTQELTGELKTFNWTLRQIIMICRNAFEIDSLTRPRIDFLELLTDILAKAGKNVAIIERIKASLLRSLIHWRPRSGTVAFFMMFLSGEYTIPDFRFLKMVFSLCFDLCYPPIDEFLDDSTLVDDANGFLIHRNHFDKVCKILLRLDHFPGQNLQNIIPNQEWPDLFPFWSFAREMITLFRECHMRFHQQIRNIFKLVGGADDDHISRDVFPDFMRFLNPDLAEGKIKDMWQTIVLFDTSEDRPTVPFPVFIKFCGECPGVTRWIEELPFLDTFDRAYKSMTEPMLAFFGFLRKRLTNFIPKFIEGLRSDIAEMVKPYVRRMRNGFLRCEISTCTMCYRYIMQYVDLKLTEQNPFQIITGGITSEDVSRMINHVMMRETLASLLLNITVDAGSEQVIKQEAALHAREKKAASQVVADD
jgi:hypothetical protein